MLASDHLPTESAKSFTDCLYEENDFLITIQNTEFTYTEEIIFIFIPTLGIKVKYYLTFKS